MADYRLGVRGYEEARPSPLEILAQYYGPRLQNAGKKIGSAFARSLEGVPSEARLSKSGLGYVPVRQREAESVGALGSVAPTADNLPFDRPRSFGPEQAPVQNTGRLDEALSQVAQPVSWDLSAVFSVPEKTKEMAFEKFKGQDLDAIFNQAMKASQGTPYDIQAALEGYRQKYAPEKEEFSKKDKAMILLDLGMRMMAGAGKPGASTASAIGEAGLGAMAQKRAIEEGIRERNLASEQRAEQRALGALGIELKGREMEDARLGRAIQAGTAAAGRAAKEDELALKDIESRRKAQVDVADIDLKRAQAEKARAEASGRIGGKSYEFNAIKDAWLATVPGATEEEALRVALGQKQLSPAERSNLARQMVAARLKATGLEGTVAPEEYDAMLMKAEQSLGGKSRESGVGAEPKRITTQAEYDALPSGAEYVDPDDGKRYRKP